MIRVMLLATDLERGGLPLRLSRMALRLRTLGIEPVVGSLAPRGPLASELEARGVETFSCDAAGRYDATCLGRLVRHVLRIDPDILHAFLFHANVAARLVGRWDRPRPVITSTVTIEFQRRWHLWIEALTSGLSDLHMANSQSVADHLRTDLGFRNEQIVVVPNAIDPSAIEAAPPVDRMKYGIGDDLMLVVWAGRMDPVKDLATFVNAVGRASRSRPTHAVLLGDGPERRRIELLAGERGIRGLFTFIGWTSDVAGWLKAADALLFPSLTEGSPNVVLEAIACGCPVVAADLPGCRELITSPMFGRTCPSGCVAAFAEALLAMPLRRDAPFSPPLDERRKFGHRHSLDQVGQLWRAVYDRVLEGSHNQSFISRL